MSALGTLEARVNALERALQDALRIVNQYDRVARPRASSIKAYIGKTDAAHDKDAMGTINVYSGDALSETATGEEIEAANKFADLEEDAWVIVLVINGEKYLIAAECTTS